VTPDDDPVTPDSEVDARLDREGARPWPGPDLYTLRGWVEVDLALDSDIPVDAAHALLSDAAQRAFGHRVFEWVGEALAAEGRAPDDLAALVVDGSLAERVVDRLRARMGEDDEAPDPPDTDLSWSAYPPDDPGGGRSAYRRALRERREKARRALVEPRRRRVAGPRG
jgi:hypothetical protein